MNLLFLVCQLIADQPCELAITAAPPTLELCQRHAPDLVAAWENRNPGWHHFGQPWCEPADTQPS